MFYYIIYSTLQYIYAWVANMEAVFFFFVFDGTHHGQLHKGDARLHRCCLPLAVGIGRRLCQSRMQWGRRRVGAWRVDGENAHTAAVPSECLCMCLPTGGKVVAICHGLIKNKGRKKKEKRVTKCLSPLTPQ